MAKAAIKTPHVSAPWWSRAVPDACALCAINCLADQYFRCAACDRVVCVECAVVDHESATAICGECRTNG